MASVASKAVFHVAPPSRLQESRHIWAVNASFRVRMWVMKIPRAFATTFWLWLWNVP